MAGVGEESQPDNTVQEPEEDHVKQVHTDQRT